MTTNLIEKLDALKAQASTPATPAIQTPASPAPVRGGTVRPNQFAGRCEKCGQTVEPGEGSFRRGATGWITFHIECPDLNDTRTNDPRAFMSAPRPVQPEEGIYVLDDGSIVKIKERKDKTGRYSLLWVESGAPRLTEQGETVHGDFKYAPELRAQCNEGNRMTVEQAKAFGIRHGKCVRCGRYLTDARSVERAIGPVCIRSFRVA